METNRHLLIVQLGPTSAPLGKLQTARASLKRIKTVLDSLRGASYTLAFSSQDAKSFGFLLKSQKTAKQLLNVLQAPDSLESTAKWGTEKLGSAFMNDDSVLILELGKDFVGLRFGTAAAWLQHN